jgi:hypothetical protein
MMSFLHYQGLSDTFQHILPCYWLAELFNKTHRKNPNQVRLYLEEKDDVKRRLTKVPPQSYLYGKNNGVPFKNFEKVLLINQLVPQSIDILNHPVWLLIDMVEPTIDELKKVEPLFSLPLQVQISNRDFIEGSTLFLMNELDRLGWIFYQIRKNQLTGEILKISTFNHYILKTLLHLFCVVYPKNPNNFELYNVITKSLPRLSSKQTIRRVTLVNFPKQLEQINYPCDFDRMCQVYSDLFHALIRSDTVLTKNLRRYKDTEKILRQYNYFHDLNKLKPLSIDLSHHHGISPDQQASLLGKLRIDAHLNHYPILPRKVYRMFYYSKDLLRNGKWELCEESNFSVSNIIQQQSGLH